MWLITEAHRNTSKALKKVLCNSELLCSTSKGTFTEITYDQYTEIMAKIKDDIKYINWTLH